MAHYQIIFRNHAGDHTMIVDDPTPDDQPITYVHQPLEIGATVKTNGTTWIVIDDADSNGLRRITCSPAP